MESYFTERPKLYNEGSKFSCPDSCERYGCKEPNLHVSISLVDLAAISLTSGQKILKGWTDQMGMTAQRITPQMLISSTGTGFFPFISANYPCSFGSNVITLEQSKRFWKEEVVKWVSIR